MSDRNASLERFCARSAKLTGPERLTAFLALTADEQEQCWQALRDGTDEADHLAGLEWMPDGTLADIDPHRPCPNVGARYDLDSGYERDGDPLLMIPAAIYVEQLSGREVRSHFALCPFHDERSPSLHCGGRQPGLWRCFGCGRAGSIFDFASLLWGVPTRGRPFFELRLELLRRFA